jgi:DNA polymerase III delta prime subunit
MQSILDRTDKLAHCILFYGSDIEAQYELALELARKLNSDELSQKWLSDNKHPAVVTVTKEEGKTAISIEQARQIKNSLGSTSDYHRVFIFYDAAGLNENNFTDEAANALLKTFEEPPNNTTFFFLTKNKDDMLATIISRAQSFYVSSNKPENRDYPSEAEFLNVQRNAVLDYAARIKDIPPEQIQNYILAVLKQNPHDTRLINAIKDVEDAKKQLSLGIKPEVVAETLAFKLVL